MSTEMEEDFNELFAAMATEMEVDFNAVFAEMEAEELAHEGARRDDFERRHAEMMVQEQMVTEQRASGPWQDFDLEAWSSSQPWNAHESVYSSLQLNPLPRADSRSFVPEDPFVENTPSTNAFDLQGTGEEESSTSSSDSPTLVDMSNRYVPPSGAIPSGLREVLDATSRTPRDSSVTSMPPLESPQPNRTFQSQLHHIENTMNSTKLGQGGSKNGTSISSQSSTNKHPGGGPVHHRSQGSSNPMRGPGTQSQGLVLHRGQGHRGAQNPNSGRNNLLSAGPSTEMGVHNANLKPAQVSATFRARFREVQQLFDKVKNMPPQLREEVRQALSAIMKEFEDSERSVRTDYEKKDKAFKIVQQQLTDTQKQLIDAQKQVSNLIEDRSKIAAERDALILKTHDLGLKSKNSYERLKALETQWQELNDVLTEKIKVQEEQLKGKRALWLDAHPTSSARRDAMTAIRDPFDSPSANHTPGTAVGRMDAMDAVQGPTQPPFGFTNFSNTSTANLALAPPKMSFLHDAQGQGVRRRPVMNLPVGRPGPAYEPQTLQEIAKSSRTYKTEPADDIPKSMALVLQSREEQLAIQYKLGFHKLYSMIERWVRKYTSRPNPDNDRLIASSNQVLWDYMMNCTYPGNRQDSHHHVIALLNDVRSRSWFVMRMAATYCTKDITHPKTFIGFGAESDRVLKEVEKAMEERGLSNEPRQILVDQQARAIQGIVSSPNYSQYRAKKLNFHTKNLRDMIGPLLNSDAARADAGQELGGIVITAWDLTVKMTTSHLTFQVYFPETCTKFTAATMHAKDTNIDPLQLQIRQARLKLVVTPVITMRDDRGTTIMAKGILPAEVLLMG